jgi:trehalose 6-phosphate phosphatase
MDFETLEAGDGTRSQPEAFSSGGLNPAATAFFFDFDGTLAEIVPEPHLASVEPATLAALGRLHDLAGGAVAVISGRSIAQLDALLQPLRLPVAGVHGLERRDSGGEVHCAPIDANRHGRLAKLIDTFVASHPGLIAETKPGSVALHYRQRPDLQSECLALVEGLAESVGPIQLLRGKMVVEMALAFLTKGDAIADFMREAPFHGRRPWFAGDDVTDETGFAIVNAMGGISVKVGQGTTGANYRVADVASIAMHLNALTAA